MEWTKSEILTFGCSTFDAAILPSALPAPRLVIRMGGPPLFNGLDGLDERCAERGKRVVCCLAHSEEKCICKLILT